VAGLAVALGPWGAARAAVELTGVEGPVAANVRAYLTIDDRPCDADPRIVRQEFRGVDAQVRSALEAFGFYAASLETSLELGADCWTAKIDVRPGEPVLVRTLDVELAGAATEDPPFAAAIAGSGLAVGKPLEHAAYEQLKTRLLDLARDRGYARAALSESRIDVYPEERAADIALHFDSGPRYDFGAIMLRQDVLRDDLVQGFLDFRPGQPYRSRVLNDAYVALTNSGYFDIVDIRPLPPNDEAQTIDVEVALTPSRRRQISYGVGFSTDTGPRIRFSRTNRRFNDRGHQLSVNAEISPVVSEFNANYRYPFGDPRYEWMSFDGGVKRQETDTSYSKSLEFGARRVRERVGGWSRTLMLGLLVEDFEVADQAGTSRLLMPGTLWSRVRGDNALRPANGWRIEFELRGAADNLGSDTTFVQNVSSGKWIKSLESKARLIASAKLGLTAVDNFDDLPPSVRFFAGGDNSIRGYDFQSLGPTDDAGKVIGGRGLALASFEYEHPIRNRWSFATFVDAGNAFNQRDFDVKVGAGIGARWQSPLGPIRIDVGFPVNETDHSPRLHITLGPDL
jgi:translocation and assembly module TamA